MVHEICHLFFEKIRKHEYNPLWLCEGLATYLQHNKKRFKKKTKISYEELAISFNDLKSSSYAVFVSFTDYLIKKYGKEKCIKLLKETYRKKADEAVNRIYGKSIRALIKDANKSK